MKVDIEIETHEGTMTVRPTKRYQRDPVRIDEEMTAAAEFWGSLTDEQHDTLTNIYKRALLALAENIDSVIQYMTTSREASVANINAKIRLTDFENLFPSEGALK